MVQNWCEILIKKLKIYPVIWSNLLKINAFIFSLFHHFRYKMVQLKSLGPLVWVVFLNMLTSGKFSLVKQSWKSVTGLSPRSSSEFDNFFLWNFVPNHDTFSPIIFSFHTPKGVLNICRETGGTHMGSWDFRPFLRQGHDFLGRLLRRGHFLTAGKWIRPTPYPGSNFWAIPNNNLGLPYRVHNSHFKSSGWTRVEGSTATEKAMLNVLVGLQKVIDKQVIIYIWVSS